MCEFPHVSVSKFRHLLSRMSRLSEEMRERTKQFASPIVRLYIQLPGKRREVEVIGHQLLRSGTSVAAHVREAVEIEIRCGTVFKAGRCNSRGRRIDAMAGITPGRLLGERSVDQ
jgi:hypothetical protein